MNENLISTSKALSRTRTGCLTCRRRRKKCDERHPTCLGCERNQLICLWPILTDHQWNTESSDDLSKVALASSPDPKRLPPADLGTAPLGLVVSALPVIFRHPPAARLVDFYTNITAQRIIGRSHIENPFITHFLRIATVSPALQHAILAVSSTHRSFSDPYFLPISYEHYAVALRGLKTGITTWGTCSSTEKIALLATSLTLCWYEVIDSNMKGSVRHHLRASALMIRGLQNDKRWRDDQILGFFLEQHSYLSIVSNIGIEHTDYELGHRKLHRPLVELNYGSPIYGFLFGCSHTIYQSIPAIRALARRSRTEGRSTRVEEEFGFLLAKITNWQPDNVDNGTEYEQGGRMYQAACLIFLHSSMRSTTQPTVELYNQIEPCITLFLDNFKNLSCDSPPWTTFMWPTLISGSCMRDAEQRALLAQTLCQSKLQMYLVENTAYWLSLHWQKMGKDETVYGPLGLEDTIRDLGLIPCIG